MELTNGEIKMVDRIFLGASHWSCGCLNTYHPRFECPSMSESERAEHKARSLGHSSVDIAGQDAMQKIFGKELARWTQKMLENIDKPLFFGYDPASFGGGQSAIAVFSRAPESLYEECLATQEAPCAPNNIHVSEIARWPDPGAPPLADKPPLGLRRKMPAASSVGSGDQEAARLFGSAVYGQFRRGKMLERQRLVESDAFQATRRIGTAPVIPELEAANRTIAVLREGIEKANAEIMRLRDELARRPAAFVEPEPDKPNPFRDFTTDHRRMGPL